MVARAHAELRVGISVSRTVTATAPSARRIRRVRRSASSTLRQQVSAAVDD